MPLLARAAAVWLPLLFASQALAHGVSGADADLLVGGSGPRPLPFLYLGAKHMVTGYDHLLYLAGVLFFLRGARQVAGYVTAFALGHSLTLVSFVLLRWQVNGALIDAVIALSVVYKALENLDALPPRWRPDPRAAVFGFGLVHGMGLASKLQSLRIAPDGLLVNLLAFNAGVELGQLVALAVLLIGLTWWRRRSDFVRDAALVNRALITCGLVLLGVQLANYEHQDTLAAAEPSQSFERAARSDVIEIPLGLGAELEYKFAMNAGDVLVYSWSIQGPGKVYFEFHGEADGEAGGDAAPRVESYEVGDGVHESHGVLRATFRGVHGWYLLNDSDTPVVVQLRASGFYALAPAFASIGHRL